MKLSSIVITLSIAILAISLWALANRPEQEPPWPQRIQGFSFSPFREGQSPLEKIYPTLDQIEADMVLLEGKTHAIRSYTVEDGQGGQATGTVTITVNAVNDVPNAVNDSAVVINFQ